MNKRLFLTTLLLIGCIGCGGGQPDQPSAAPEVSSVAPSVTLQPTYTTAPSATPQPTYTTAPTYTPVPTSTPIPPPTQTPEPTAVPTSEGASGNWTFEKNFDLSLDCGGVVITVKEFNASSLEALHAMRKASEPDFTEDTWELMLTFLGEDAVTVGNFQIVVENTTDRLMGVFPDQGTMVVGSEQVNLVDYILLSGDVGGDIYPGVIKEGSVVFALKRTTVHDIKAVKLVINSAHDEDFASVCDTDYVFDLDLSDVVPLE